VRGREAGGPGILLILMLLVGFIYKGPALAAKFNESFGQVVAILAPTVGTIGLIAAAVLLFRFYWNRW
jgi:hypothetical protein